MGVKNECWMDVQKVWSNFIPRNSMLSRWKQLMKNWLSKCNKEKQDLQRNFSSPFIMIPAVCEDCTCVCMSCTSGGGSCLLEHVVFMFEEWIFVNAEHSRSLHHSSKVWFHVDGCCMRICCCRIQTHETNLHHPSKEWLWENVNCMLCLLLSHCTTSIITTTYIQD